MRIYYYWKGFQNRIFNRTKKEYRKDQSTKGVNRDFTRES